MSKPTLDVVDAPLETDVAVERRAEFQREQAALMRDISAGMASMYDPDLRGQAFADSLRQQAQPNGDRQPAAKSGSI